MAEGKEKADAFTREQLLRSEKYRNNRDLLAALLVEKRNYTFTEVDKMISDFMKGKVE